MLNQEKQSPQKEVSISSLFTLIERFFIVISFFLNFLPAIPAK